MLRTSIYRAGTLIVAFSILWVFVHSLIEFHQNYVFGKNTGKIQLQIIKPKGQNLKKALKCFKEKQNQGSSNQPLANVPDQTATGLAAGICKTVHYSEFYSRIPAEFSCISPSLRAPPVG